MDRLKPYLLPAVAALLYLAWWLFAPKAAPDPGAAKADPPAETGARGRGR